jgi:hypothetical protein
MLWYNRGLTARYTTRFGQSLRDFEQAAALDGEGWLADQLGEALPFAPSLADDERACKDFAHTLTMDRTGERNQGGSVIIACSR